MNPQHIIFILFIFTLGACVGSFLNVVVWRLPRRESLTRPPSHCPKCQHRLAWRDNIPVFGWIILRGKCRYCGNPISPKYPIVEAITGLIFVAYYVCFFIFQIGPCPQVANSITIFGTPGIRAMTIQQDWPIFGLYLFLIAAMLSASLIDAELFEIPRGISYWAAAVGLVVHPIIDTPTMPGSINTSAPGAALALGSGIGLLISLTLLRLGILPLSFAEGTPELDIDKQRRLEEMRNRASDGKVVDYESQPVDFPPDFTPAQIRAEMRKEMLFLMPPLILGAVFLLLCTKVPAIANIWRPLIIQHDWLSGFFGALLGGLVGGFAIWLSRILFSFALGKEAMGLGDIDLMFGVGAVLGPWGAVVAFFLAPFCGMGVTVYRLLMRKSHQIPYGPYLSLGSAITMLLYCPIAAYFSPGLGFLVDRVRDWIGI